MRVTSRRSISSRVKTVTAAPTWLVGVSVLVADTTTDSRTGATASVSTTGAVTEIAARAGLKPGSDTTAAHPSHARAKWNAPRESVNVVATSLSR